MKTILKWSSVILVILILLVATSCQKQISLEQRYDEVISYFASRGINGRIDDAKENQRVAIYLPSAWKVFTYNNEEILVYFDESNRADYLSSIVDSSVFPYVANMGLRYVFTYSGNNNEIIQEFTALNND